MIRLLRPESPVATHTPTWRDRLALSLRTALYACIDRLGVPGAVAPMEHTDKLTGDTITVRTSLRYTIITVNCREYYFDRLTGKLDGTGTGCL